MISLIRIPTEKYSLVGSILNSERCGYELSSNDNHNSTMICVNMSDGAFLKVSNLVPEAVRINDVPDFGVGDKVLHVKSNRVYHILDNSVFIENGAVLSYVYRGEDYEKWVRPVLEMDDGRFRLISRSV